MSAPGRYIPGKQREAAFASMMLPKAERDELRAREALAEEVLSRFELHHVVYFSWSKNNRWWNLDPQLKADHKRRTRTDIALIAKSKRIRRKQATHEEVMRAGALVLQDLSQRRKRKLPSRPFAKSKRIQKKEMVHKLAFMEKAALKKDGTPFRGTMAWPVKVKRKRKIPSRPFPKTKRKLRKK